MAHYARAIQRPSLIHHPDRAETRGIVIHWTAGHKAGDLAALDGPNVDCHFYVDRTGEVFEFLDSDSQAWHAFHTANHTCLGIEHEGSGEAWTPKQLEASAQLVAWLSRLYNIPVVKSTRTRTGTESSGTATCRESTGTTTPIRFPPTSAGTGT